jgi:hypothetical protein
MDFFASQLGERGFFEGSNKSGAKNKRKIFSGKAKIGNYLEIT